MKPVSISANLFAMGGNSLFAVKLHNRILAEFKVLLSKEKEKKKAVYECGLPDSWCFSYLKNHEGQVEGSLCSKCCVCGLWFI